MKPHWKAILATLGVVLPSAFTYLASRAEAGDAKKGTEAAYVTLQESVKELQEASYEQALLLAEMKGQLKAERRARSSMATTLHPDYHPPAPAPAAGADGDGVTDAMDSDVQVKLQAPPAFKDAVNSYKAKK